MWLTSDACGVASCEPAANPPSHWVDARITRIYGGTTEIMKELIGRGMGL